MQNEPEDLFIGTFTFPSPDQPDKKQFGMVGYSADPDGSNGLATIFLHLRQSGIAYENVGSSLKITLPEAQMRTLLPIVGKALEYLQSLRRAQNSDPAQG